MIDHFTGAGSQHLNNGASTAGSGFRPQPAQGSIAPSIIEGGAVAQYAAASKVEVGLRLGSFSWQCSMTAGSASFSFRHAYMYSQASSLLFMFALAVTFGGRWHHWWQLSGSWYWTVAGLQHVAKRLKAEEME